MDGDLAEALVRSRRFFTRAEVSKDLRSLHRTGGRQADEFYRDRWSHDKVVRSTHGVNCTGSCSWKVYVKDGIITWEAQQTDYPSVGPDRPEYEPRGCPRGAAEARYRGQKVVAVSPDYADNVKFADEWLPAQPGTDGALAMAMGHVVLKEFFVDRETEYFTSYVKRYTDLPFLVTLDEAEAEAEPGTYVPGKFLTAADLGAGAAEAENAEFRTVLLDAATGEPVVPNGTLGDRYGESGAGKWNLDLGDTEPLLSADGGGEAPVTVDLPRFDAPVGSAYHIVAVALGIVAGVATVGGLAILIHRRRTVGPVFSATTRNDKAMYVSLTVTIALGLSATVAANVVGGGYDYRETISPWFRSIFYLQPDPDLMTGAPVLFQLHALSALLLFAAWSFTRLVHMLTAPLGYLTRPYIVYRSRDTGLGACAPRRGWERSGS
ncbi:respiratory nitrate reductase subunit gamma [Streptomyces sp. SD15]